MSSGRIHHVGIVVDDFQKGLALLSEVFGLEVDELFDLPTAKAALLRWGDVQLELRQLSEPLTPQEEVGGLRGRIDHIAIEVEDINETFAAVRSKGIETRQEEPQPASTFLTFHTKPASSGDVLFQFVQTAPG